MGFYVFFCLWRILREKMARTATTSFRAGPETFMWRFCVSGLENLARVLIRRALTLKLAAPPRRVRGEKMRWWLTLKHGPVRGRHSLTPCLNLNESLQVCGFCGLLTSFGPPTCYIDGEFWRWVNVRDLCWSGVVIGMLGGLSEDDWF